MIVLKELRWSNAFSYGPDNKINFISSPLVQLVGKNGHGKSSIALILEEVLYNKNSKGIKKADILNRYLPQAKNYSIELDFEKDSDSYTIKSTRGSTQTVKLFKNDKDISSHTATGTYKVIEQLIGIDHKTFGQIVYQSNASSLEFLTATDSNRKKFLIELLNLNKYTKAGEVFKELTSEVNKGIAAANAKVSTVTTWLNKYKGQDLKIQKLLPEPEFDESLLVIKQETEANIKNADSLNKQILANNKNKAALAAIEIVEAEKPENIGDTLTQEAAKREQIALSAQEFINKINSISGQCPTCMQEVDEEKHKHLIDEKKAEQAKANAERLEIKTQLTEYKAKRLAWQNYQQALKDVENYKSIINDDLPEELVSKVDLEQELLEVSLKIKHLKQEIAEVQQKNKDIEAKNSKAETISAQLIEFQDDLAKATKELEDLNSQLNILNILTKTFSTTGLIAYKLENLVKDLEDLTNDYLVELSDGRFQISFKVSASDKLNVIITDNAKDIDILALSGGERARVNVATLLAIRKLMQSLSSSRINLLILDETVEALDTEGKEKLVEVLLREDSLNTLVVSHGFTHPLLDKVQIVKEENISRIEV